MLRQLAAATLAPARYVASHSAWRSRADVAYDALPWPAKAAAHRAWAKLFRTSRATLEPGRWRVHFAGRELTVPLHADRAWLDWDTALSLLGHEPEIKRTYAALVKSPRRPRLFFDVGGSYGTHSLLLLAHGVRVVIRARQRARRLPELCRANGVAATASRSPWATAGRSISSSTRRDTWAGMWVRR
jgi:hypothetical protein